MKRSADSEWPLTRGENPSTVAFCFARNARRSKNTNEFNYANSNGIAPSYTFAVYTANVIWRDHKRVFLIFGQTREVPRAPPVCGTTAFRSYKRNYSFHLLRVINVPVIRYFRFILFHLLRVINVSVIRYFRVPVKYERRSIIRSLIIRLFARPVCLVSWSRHHRGGTFGRRRMMYSVDVARTMVSVTAARICVDIIITGLDGTSTARWRKV